MGRLREQGGYKGRARRHYIDAPISDDNLADAFVSQGDTVYLMKHMDQAQRHRKISPFEWLYLAANQGFAPCAVQLQIRASTLPTRAALEAALATAARANVNVRLVARGRWWIDSGKSPRVRELPGTELASLVHPVFHENFAFDPSPAIEVLAWEGTGLIFRCSHALMDGGGLIFFAEETFRALRGEPLLGTTFEKSTRDYLLGLKHPGRRPWHRPDKISPLGPPVCGASGFVWETRTVPGRVSAIGARVASSLSQLVAARQPGGLTRIMSPVDLRQLDERLRSAGNLSNALFYEAPAAASWHDFYSKTVAAFARQEERVTSSADAAFPWLPIALWRKLSRWAHERQARADGYLYSGMLSNVGNVSLKALSAPDFQATSVSLLPFDAPGAAVSIITVQHDDGVEISASAPAVAGSQGRLGLALDCIVANLEAGCSVPRTGPPPAPVYAPEDGPTLLLPQGLCTYQLFQDQVDRHPAHIALSDATRRLRYDELDRWVRQCAAHLQARGVAPNSHVAIMAGRSIETIAIVLAILHLGAAFVPIDMEWPEERIRFVLGDCQPVCVVVEDAHAEQAETITNPVLFSALQRPVAGLAAKAVPSGAASTAYILYTSGSTGRPKGVVVPQSSLLNYLLWAQETYREGMATPLVFPFFTSLSFDLTLTAIFVPLVTGGEVRVFAQRDPLLAIHAILADPGINAVKLTPSHLRLFAEVGVQSSGIRKYIPSGEALPTSPARQVTEQSNGRAEVFNEYGPTEATIACVVHRYDIERDTAAFVPIGRPIANTEVMLLDDQSRLVPPGEVGEVFLAGECLARGYLARPEEDKRFQAHPFRAGQRMYRTGDRALRMPDGNFDYRGRLDGQVKIRGHRVELGEIEAVIEASGLCLSCAVVREESAQGTRVVAFVVWGDAGGEASLMAALAKQLPVYMLPACIVGLEAMPLNVNGKIDKARLPTAQVASATVHGDEAISDPLEQALASMLTLADGTPIDGLMSMSLLDLGVDSLQMMLLLTRAARRFLPEGGSSAFFAGTAHFLKQPTLSQLAMHLRSAGAIAPGRLPT